MIPISKPIIGEAEKQAVMEVLDSGMLAQGPRTARFEERFAQVCGVKHAIATTSGTTALHIALLANGVGEGDEVITTPFTFIASANSILFTGAKPVFVDIDPETFNIDPEQVEQGRHAAHEGDHAGASVRLYVRHGRAAGHRRSARIERSSRMRARPSALPITANRPAASAPAASACMPPRT